MLSIPMSLMHQLQYKYDTTLLIDKIYHSTLEEKPTTKQYQLGIGH